MEYDDEIKEELDQFEEKENTKIHVDVTQKEDVEEIDNRLERLQDLLKQVNS